MVSIVATPDAVSWPPEVAFEVSAGDGSTIESLQVTRGGAPIVGTPVTGFETALVSDYAMPYGEAVAYQLSGTVESTVVEPTLWAETWEDLDAWTLVADGGSWTVEDGTAVATSPTGTSATLSRAAAVTRVTIDSLTLANAAVFTLVLRDEAGAAVLTVTVTGDASYGWTYLSGGSGDGKSAHYVGGFEVAIRGGIAYLAAPGVALKTPISGTPATVDLWSGMMDPALPVGTAVIGPVTAYGLPTTTVTPFTESVTVTVTPDSAWIIHPRTPALSVPLSVGPTAGVVYLAKDGIQSVGRAAQATSQRPAGSSDAVVFTLGARAATAATLSLLTTTRDALAAFEALIQDETPVIIRVPPAWDLPLEERFWSIGDVTRSKVASPRRHVWRWDVPLSGAAAPRTIVSPTWSEAALVLEFATEADVVDAFQSEYGKVTNERGL